MSSNWKLQIQCLSFLCFREIILESSQWLFYWPLQLFSHGSIFCPSRRLELLRDCSTDSYTDIFSWSFIHFTENLRNKMNAGSPLNTNNLLCQKLKFMTDFMSSKNAYGPPASYSECQFHN